MHRSRRLLGVRSSDLYQNEAEFLYFHVVLAVFKTITSLFWYFGKHGRVRWQKHTFPVGLEAWSDRKIKITWIIIRNIENGKITILIYLSTTSSPILVGIRAFCDIYAQGKINIRSLTHLRKTRSRRTNVSGSV